MHFRTFNNCKQSGEEVSYLLYLKVLSFRCWYCMYTTIMVYGWLMSCLSGWVVYSIIILDGKLDAKILWKTHFEHTTSKVLPAFWQLIEVFSKTWGLSSGSTLMWSDPLPVRLNFKGQSPCVVMQSVKEKNGEVPPPYFQISSAMYFELSRNCDKEFGVLRAYATMTNFIKPFLYHWG